MFWHFISNEVLSIVSPLQVFEIENEFGESANDPHGYGSVDQQHVSQTSIQATSHTLPRAITTRRMSDPKPPSPAKSIPRHRLTSFGRAVEGPSPLAQIYQPLVVQDAQESAALGPSGVSFGPAHRRRLSSMQSTHRITHPDPLGIQEQSTSLRRFPVMSTTPLSDAPLSESPDQHLGSKDEITGDAGNAKQLIARLDTMEQRQERIEDMLIQLTSYLKAQ